MSIHFPKSCKTRAARSAWARKVAMARWANADTEPRAELPDLVRRITLDDFVSGARHIFDLHRCGRIDQYRVVVDGKEWQSAAGLSRILAGIRKAWLRFRRNNP